MARIAVTSAVVISIARFLWMSRLVWSIGRLTMTAPARLPSLTGAHLPGDVCRITWFGIRLPAPWQSIRQPFLNRTAWMYWYSRFRGSFLLGTVRETHIGVPSAKVYGLREVPALALVWAASLAAARRNRS